MVPISCNMAVEQIKVGRDNFSYLIYCKRTGYAALVDPGANAYKSLGRISHLQLNLRYIINTHHHQDHVGDNSRIKERTNCRIIASDRETLTDYDIGAEDSSTLDLGDIQLKFLHTPGHSIGGMCIIVDDKYLLTGDTLFINDCGRTDFPGGNDEEMFGSMQKLKGLQDNLIVYPGHDYGPRAFDSLGNQKKTNKCLKVSSAKALSNLL